MFLFIYIKSFKEEFVLEMLACIPHIVHDPLPCVFSYLATIAIATWEFLNM